MKLIITESKRDKIVIDWLDKYYDDIVVVQKNYSYYQFFKNGYLIFIVVGTAFVVTHFSLYSHITNLFGLDEETLTPIINSWMSDNYGLKINSVVFEYDYIK